MLDTLKDLWNFLKERKKWWLLPIIIVGQNVQAAAADARSEATYNDAAAVLLQTVTTPVAATEVAPVPTCWMNTEEPIGKATDELSGTVTVLAVLVTFIPTMASRSVRANV